MNAVLSDSVPVGADVPVVLEIVKADGAVTQSNAVTIDIEDGVAPLPNVATPF